LKDLLLNSFEHFFAEHSDILASQDVYGLTILLSPEMQSIGCVIGTTKCLKECIADYKTLGYKNTQTNATDSFTDWLKWSGPDEAAWTGIYSTAFDKFNDKMTENLQNGVLELYSTYLVDLIIDNIDNIRALLAINNIPIICVYFEHDFELEELNKKINTPAVYAQYVTEVIAMQNASNYICKT